MPVGNRMAPMDKAKFPLLRAHLRSLKTTEQVAFSEKCGTTIAYLRKFLCRGGSLGAGIVAGLVEHSSGAIPASELNPKVDWTVFERFKTSRPARLRASVCPPPGVHFPKPATKINARPKKTSLRKVG